MVVVFVGLSLVMLDMRVGFGWKLYDLPSE